MSPDFLSSNRGSIVYLTPLNNAAAKWVEDNLDTWPDANDSIAIEHRMFLPIATELLLDGFTLEDVDTGRRAELPA